MKLDIVRAWKDEAYRQSLSNEQASLLPANPAGELELNEADLEAVYGGGKTLLNIIKISNIRLFSVDVLANPLNQTCVQTRV